MKISLVSPQFIHFVHACSAVCFASSLVGDLSKANANAKAGPNQTTVTP